MPVIVGGAPRVSARLDSHSSRGATAGATRAARSAGNKLAAPDEGQPRNSHGEGRHIPWFEAEQQSRGRLASRRGQGRARQQTHPHQPGSFLHHQLHDASRSAPRAMRMPISFLRCETMKEITPYKPIVASSAASSKLFASIRPTKAGAPAGSHRCRASPTSRFGREGSIPGQTRE